VEQKKTATQVLSSSHEKCKHLDQVVSQLRLRISHMGAEIVQEQEKARKLHKTLKEPSPERHIAVLREGGCDITHDNAELAANAIKVAVSDVQATSTRIQSHIETTATIVNAAVAKVTAAAEKEASEKKEELDSELTEMDHVPLVAQSNQDTRTNKSLEKKLMQVKTQVALTRKAETALKSEKARTQAKLKTKIKKAKANIKNGLVELENMAHDKLQNTTGVRQAQNSTQAEVVGAGNETEMNLDGKTKAMFQDWARRQLVACELPGDECKKQSVAQAKVKLHELRVQQAKKMSALVNCARGHFKDAEDEFKALALRLDKAQTRLGSLRASMQAKESQLKVCEDEATVAKAALTKINSKLQKIDSDRKGQELKETQEANKFEVHKEKQEASIKMLTQKMHQHAKSLKEKVTAALEADHKLAKLKLSTAKEEQKISDTLKKEKSQLNERSKKKFVVTKLKETTKATTADLTAKIQVVKELQALHGKSSLKAKSQAQKVKDIRKEVASDKAMDKKAKNLSKQRKSKADKAKKAAKKAEKSLKDAKGKVKAEKKKVVGTKKK